MEKFIQNILVPVDFSDKAAYGINYAAALVGKYGGKITAINVIKGVDPIWSDFFSNEERNHLLEKIRLSIEHFAKKHTAGFTGEINILIKKGKFCETILNTVKEEGITLISMGTSTENNIKKWIIGSNALRIVSEAPCPVITLKDFTTFPEIKTIVLPLDLTKESREKTVHAVSLAKLYGAKIMVVSAQTLDDGGISSKLNNQLKQVLHFIEERKVECFGEIIKADNRAQAICNYIDEQNANLIIITTHQQLEVVQAFLGSFAKHIIKEANIPVMSIVPKLKHTLESRMPGTA